MKVITPVILGAMTALAAGVTLDMGYHGTAQALQWITVGCVFVAWMTFIIKCDP